MRNCVASLIVALLLANSLFAVITDTLESKYKAIQTTLKTGMSRV